MDEPASATPPRSADLPVDDDDRAHVMALLQQAVGRGLLDTPEFDRRSGLVISARTRADLNRLVVDLGPTHPDRARAETAAQTRRAARPGGAPAAGSGTAHDGTDTSGTLALRLTLGTVSRRGTWAVPRRLELDGWCGSAELDLTGAVIDHDVIEIDLDVTLGSVELRLPEETGVVLDGVVATAGSVEDKRRAPTTHGRPRVVVSGRITLGSVEVTGPKRPWGTAG